MVLPGAEIALLESLLGHLVTDLKTEWRNSCDLNWMVLCDSAISLCLRLIQIHVFQMWVPIKLGKLGQCNKTEF